MGNADDFNNMICFDIFIKFPFNCLPTHFPLVRIVDSKELPFLFLDYPHAIQESGQDAKQFPHNARLSSWCRRYDHLRFSKSSIENFPHFHSQRVN